MLFRSNWWTLSENTHPDAISLLAKNLDKVEWCALSANPSAVSIIENNLDKAVWSFVSRNPNAIHLLEENPTEINWEDFFHYNTNPISSFWFDIYSVYLNFSIHPQIICLYLDQNPAKYTAIKRFHSYFLRCPDCFEIDYMRISEYRTRLIMKELMQKTWHPVRVENWIKEDVDFW